MANTSGLVLSVFQTTLFLFYSILTWPRKKKHRSTVRVKCLIQEPRLGGGGGLLPKKLGRGVRPASQNPYPIYDQNLWFSLLYLWPDQKFDTLFMTYP